MTQRVAREACRVDAGALDRDRHEVGDGLAVDVPGGVRSTGHEPVAAARVPAELIPHEWMDLMVVLESALADVPEAVLREVKHLACDLRDLESTHALVRPEEEHRPRPAVLGRV